ncbi:casein kinase II subunit beta' [Trichomonascus vanleenenianus]|uniref:casein kinase 2 regulatory subunit CKB2 n=1 Tax=Trichomonascus vanleenenianus TaxID=2268995 RepID=UPI003EC9ACC0
MAEQDESGSDYSGYSEYYWIDWFLGAKGNEYFCDIDTEYITDRFNLTGLNLEVSCMQQAIDIITDNFDTPCKDEERELYDTMAQHLYGLVHARYILTARGLQKMLEKYRNCDFGICPRVYCQQQPLLPIGLSDQPRTNTVKLYCPKCEDLYNPKSSRHSRIDGAYFGTSFPGMLFQVYPQLVPSKSSDRFVPTIFGFKIHRNAKLARWQERKRLEQEERLAVVEHKAR